MNTAYTNLSHYTLDKAMKIVEAAKRDLERYGHLVEEMDRTGLIDPAYRRPTVMQEARRPAEGQAESRTRVTCHLPVGNVTEERAFKKIIQYLRSLKDRHIGLSGYTFTDPSASQGSGGLQRKWNG